MDRGAIVSLSPDSKKVFIPDSELSNLSIYSLTEDSQGAVWVCYRGGSVRRVADGKLTEFSSDSGFPAGTEICSMACEASGRLWFLKRGQLGVCRQNQFETLQRLAPGSG